MRFVILRYTTRECYHTPGIAFTKPSIILVSRWYSPVTSVVSIIKTKIDVHE